VGQVVTVFGGTGFLGRRVVRHLRDKGFSVRVASRHPRAPGHDPEIRPTAADIRERQSIATAVEGAFGVVNAVSLYVERGTDTFQAVHVAAAERLAEEARKAGIERFIQVSRSVPMQHRPPATSGRAGRESRPFARPSRAPAWSDRR
jgi:NADH dehydrogenase